EPRRTAHHPTPIAVASRRQTTLPLQGRVGRGVCGKGLRNIVHALIACGTLLLPSAAHADGVADFYRGRTVTVAIGFSTGSGYDLYARLLARHMGKHIPGNPSLVPQNMPGAGSLKAANYVFSVAPKDGTVIGTMSRSLPVE